MKTRQQIEAFNLQSRFTASVQCFCDDYYGCISEGNSYQCKGCQRIVPYCFGSGDEYWEYCDDCCGELTKNEL